MSLNAVTTEIVPGMPVDTDQMLPAPEFMEPPPSVLELPMEIVLRDMGQAGLFLSGRMSRDVNDLVNRLVRDRPHLPEMGNGLRLRFRNGVVPVIWRRPGGAQFGPEGRVGGCPLRREREPGNRNVIGVSRQAVGMKGQQRIGTELADFTDQRGHGSVGIDGVHTLVGPSKNEGLDAKDGGGVAQFSLPYPGQFVRRILLRDTQRAGLASGGNHHPNGMAGVDGLDECSGGAVRFIIRMGKDGEEATKHDGRG